MVDLGNLKHIIEIIQEYQFAFQRRFSQNFLISTHVLDKTVGTAGVTEQDYVLEIGPGIDIMTQYLVEHARRVVAVEIDSNLLPILDRTSRGYTDIIVINDGILKVDVGGPMNEYNEGYPVKVVTSLPYYITAPIIMGLFKSGVPIDNIMVTAQKETADRMQVGPRSKDYGALSLATQYYTELYIVANVPPNYFIPRPNMDSVVIRFIRYKGPPAQADDPRFMFKPVQASSNQCRKTLQSRFDDSSEISYDGGIIAKVIESLGVQLVIRGEALDLDQFARLSSYFTRNA